MKPLIEREPSNGLTDVPGLAAGAASCDIRGLENDRLDTAIVYSSRPCRAAGVFTSNAAPAAPVQVNRKIIDRQGTVHGVVANSGNANAWTGKRGIADAERMRELAEKECSAEPHSFLVCSTGHIGIFLPMKKLEAGIRTAAATRGSTDRHGLMASDAILTTDTGRKVVTVQFPWGDQFLTVSGMAKGAGMIHPNMATMLAFIATDAEVDQALLQRALANAVTTSFNAITVDGCMSTNDTVLLLANGCSGVAIDPSNGPLTDRFTAAIQHVCSSLAEKIVCDGEKRTKVVELLVEGAASNRDAEAIARAVGNSILVKTSWFGGDPNFGRILDAVGYSTALVREESLDLAYRSYPATSGTEPVPVVVKGEPILEKEAEWDEIVRQPRFSILFNLNLGEGSFRLLATDLSIEYVDYNKSEKF